MRWVALLLVLVNAGLVAWQVAGTPGGPAREVAPPAEVGQLALLREPAEQADAGAEAECFTIGPFDDADSAAMAGERLGELGLQPEQRSITDEETSGYQVLLPPFPSRAEAVEATQALSAAGIQDYFIVVDDEEFENAVSLGVFSERSYAVEHRRYLEGIGFSPDLRVRTRERERFWQDYRDAGKLVGAEQIEAWVGEGPLQRLPRDCD